MEPLLGAFHGVAQGDLHHSSSATMAASVVQDLAFCRPNLQCA